MSTFYLILQSTLPSLLVLAVAVYFFHASGERFLQQWKEIYPLLLEDRSGKVVKAFMEREEKLQILALKKESRQITLPLRLQAYERCVLLLERITLSKLMLRTSRQGMDTQAFQVALLQSVREEFEHNLAQQIYVSRSVWTALQKSVEDSIQLINSTSAGLEPGQPATLLAAMLIDAESLGKGPRIHEALDLIHQEVSVLIG